MGLAKSDNVFVFDVVWGGCNVQDVYSDCEMQEFPNKHTSNSQDGEAFHKHIDVITPAMIFTCMRQHGVNWVMQF